jgi:hypothetical protein
MDDLVHEIREHFSKFRFVIVWGFPLHTHTHSYIHESWTKALDKCNISWKWFDDQHFPNDFNFNNCCFITEGWADNNIPILDNCVYFVHNAVNPSKYKSARLIDLRFNVCEIHDFNNDFVLPTNCHFLSQDTLYEVLHNDASVAARRGRPITTMEYEAVYLYWATDLSPDEMNESDCELKRSNVVHYVGSTSSFYTDLHNFKHFMETQKHIPVHLYNPWTTPQSTEKVKQLIQESFCSPDFRSSGDPQHLAKDAIFNGTNHLAIGYIPCRVFKTISYGQTGITNSVFVKKLLGDYVEFAKTPEEVYQAATKRMFDTNWKKSCMKHVAERHTYLHRLRDLGRALRMGPQTSRLRSCVTAFMDIGRESIDGRSVNFYKECLLNTLTQIKEPFIIFLDKNYSHWKPFILEKRSNVGATKIIEIDQFPLQKHVEKVADILSSTDFIRKYPNDITNISPSYALLNFSKFEWVLEAAKEGITQNKSDVFAWIDAGMARFFPVGVWYNNKIPNQFAIQVDFGSSRPKLGSLTLDNYIGTNECVVKGGMFITPLNRCEIIHEKIIQILEKEMLAKNRIDNEQIALALIVQDCMDLFDIGSASLLERFFTLQ